LCSLYWYPLYAFARRKGLDAEAAADLVQGFFADLLERQALAGVDPARGRFRSFLLAACTNYLRNRSAQDQAQKRGGGLPLQSIDSHDGERRYAHEPFHSLTPERLFERGWAVTLIERVLDRLADEGGPEARRRFTLLRPALLGDGSRLPFADVADALDISPDAARAAATRLRRRYRDLLREAVAATLGDLASDADIDSEIRELFAALGA
jgi:RNA polymerase sigma-70 factor (ECF subfamily)